MIHHSNAVHNLFVADFEQNPELQQTSVYSRNDFCWASQLTSLVNIFVHSFDFLFKFLRIVFAYFDSDHDKILEFSINFFDCKTFCYLPI